MTHAQQSHSDQTPQPVVVRQGGGWAFVIAATVIAGSVVYAINVWSTTRKETAPGRNLEQGIERLRDAAGSALKQNP